MASGDEEAGEIVSPPSANSFESPHALAHKRLFKLARKNLFKLARKRLFKLARKRLFKLTRKRLFKLAHKLLFKLARKHLFKLAYHQLLVPARLRSLPFSSAQYSHDFHIPVLLLSGAVHSSGPCVCKQSAGPAVLRLEAIHQRGDLVPFLEVPFLESSCSSCPPKLRC